MTAAGVEAVLADPDRLATLLPALDQVSVLILPLGNASGTPDLVAALHGPRLVALLGKLVDTPIRGVVYERVGSVDSAILARGAAEVASACDGSRIPYEFIDSDPATWPQAAAAAVERVLKGPGGG